MLSEIANIPIARNKPVLGSGNFIRESGIGIQYVMNDPLVMFGTHPALTGQVGRGGARQEKRQGLDRLQARMNWASARPTTTSSPRCSPG